MGDPIVFLLERMRRQTRFAARTDLGLDQPFFVQFAHFLGNAMQGEFGLSLRQGAKVSRLIAERFSCHDGAGDGCRLAWRWLLGIPMGVLCSPSTGSFIQAQLFMTLSRRRIQTLPSISVLLRIACDHLRMAITADHWAASFQTSIRLMRWATAR